jgi:flagellar biosynthesis/type III secretory pathway protein FliH
MGETTNRQRLAMVVAGVAAVLIAAVVGLSLGKSAAPERSDPALSTEEVFAEARQEAIAEVEEMTSRQGIRDGRKAGARQGARAGRRAGESDGGVQVQEQATEAAQATAAGAQSELSAIASSPPTP